MTNFIIAVVILAILGLAIGYIVRAKRQGVHCIGCASGCKCNGDCGGHCSCHPEA